MKCPHCGKEISRVEMAAGMGAAKSEAKAVTSAENGKDWQKPHFRKTEHFLSLNLFEGIESNEWKFKVKVPGGSTYNPDFYHPASDCYIEVATSKPNISEQGEKWKKAMKLINLRVFWWEGQELTDKFRTRPRKDKRNGK